MICGPRFFESTSPRGMIYYIPRYFYTGNELGGGVNEIWERKWVLEARLIIFGLRCGLSAIETGCIIFSVKFIINCEDVHSGRFDKLFVDF